MNGVHPPFSGSKHLNNLTYNESKKEVGYRGYPTFLGSEHLNNLTYHKGKAEKEKELVWPRHTNLLGCEHLNNFTYNEGKAVYLKNIEKEVDDETSSTILSSRGGNQNGSPPF